MLRDSLESEHAFDEFKRFLEAHADRHVLFSAEALTNWLVLGEKQEAFLKLLDAAQDVMHTRCIWTLRRYDELIRSLFLLRLKRVPRAFNARSKWKMDLNGQFASLRRVEEAVGDDVVYVKYSPAGDHNAELLSAFGLTGEVASLICGKLASGPRLHASPSHKEAVALINCDALSARAGIELDEEALRLAFRRGDFKFERDRRCELVSPAWQREVHEKAMAAAHKHEVSAYVEFFKNVEISGSTSLGLGVETIADAGTKAITDEDLGRLVTFVDQPHQPAD